ncbi:MAG: DNA alkylation repair protein [Dermatophilaceae bacterium]|nr:DNA alkylation repair protein [Intrasporangiaceae bacterium]
MRPLPATTPGGDLVPAIDVALAARADPERAVGQQRYMKSRLPYLGLTSPVLRQAVRPVLADPAYRIAERSEWERTVRHLWKHATHREHWYAALALLAHRHYRTWRDPQVLPLLEDLIRDGAWWDVVDSIATHEVRDLLLGWPGEIAPTLRRWSRDRSLWVRRAAILAQVGAKDRTDPALLSELIQPNLMDPDFFSRKAIGWALRDYARTDPAWVRTFVAARPELSALSRREALKHL